MYFVIDLYFISMKTLSVAQTQTRTHAPSQAGFEFVSVAQVRSQLLPTNSLKMPVMLRFEFVRCK